MKWETLVALFIVLVALGIVHEIVHIDLDKPPDRVILALEVGIITLISVAIMWDHILALLIPSHQPPPHFSPEMINSIVLAFTASVLLYLVARVILKFV
jgi:hypothetical protein